MEGSGLNMDGESFEQIRSDAGHAGEGSQQRGNSEPGSVALE